MESNDEFATPHFFDNKPLTKHRHRTSKKSGIKRVEKEVMMEYKREVDRIKKQKKCKIPTLKQFLDKRFKTRKHHRKSRKSAESEPVALIPVEAEESKEEESTAVMSEEPKIEEPKPEETKPAETNQGTIADALSSINPFSPSEKKGGKKTLKQKSKKHRKH